MPTPPASPKSALRARMRVVLRDFSESPQPLLHPHVAAWLRDHPNLQCIAFFAAMPGEPDLLPLIESFPDRQWCLPRVVDAEEVAFHRVVDPVAELAASAFGIREPSADAPRISLHEIDAFLCPGLAFDARGGRLGRGRGYYDRLLAAARTDAVKIGVCFACQLVETTFAEAHDVAMDAVISNHGPAHPAG